MGQTNGRFLAGTNDVTWNVIWLLAGIVLGIAIARASGM